MDGRVAALEGTYLEVVREWGQSIEASDTYTFGHCERVAQGAVALAAALGLHDDAPTQGMNLLPAFQGHIPPPDVAQYAEARLAEEGFGMAPLAGVRHDGRKWIQAPRPELYDLERDPGERTNVASAHPDVVARAERYMEQAHVPAPAWTAHAR